MDQSFKSEIVVSSDRVYHLGLQKGQLAPNIFLVGDPARCYKIAAHFENIQHEVKHREYVTLTGSYQGIPVSVIGTGIGTDNVEIALVEIYTLFEFDFKTAERISEHPTVNFIRIGTSGGIQSDIPAGTMGIASFALGMDSTGLYYDHAPVHPFISRIEIMATEILEAATPDTARFKGKIPLYAAMADPLITATLIEEAKKENIPFVSGITASSPGFYGPSARYIEGLNNTVPHVKQVLAQFNMEGLRIINMEMESSILFHLCSQLGYRAGTICPVISNPSSSADIVDYDKTIQQAISIGLGAMKNIAGSDS